MKTKAIELIAEELKLENKNIAWAREHNKKQYDNGKMLDRITKLKIAGALIAAELDRLLLIEEKENNPAGVLADTTE